MEDILLRRVEAAPIRSGRGGRLAHRGLAGHASEVGLEIRMSIDIL